MSIGPHQNICGGRGGEREERSKEEREKQKGRKERVEGGQKGGREVGQITHRYMYSWNKGEGAVRNGRGRDREAEGGMRAPFLLLVSTSFLLLSSS